MKSDTVYFRSLKKKFPFKVHEYQGAFVGVIRDQIHGRWYRTLRTYPTAADTKKVCVSAQKHLVKGQFDGSIVLFSGDL
jgi:hypothetical protein